MDQQFRRTPWGARATALATAAVLASIGACGGGGGGVGTGGTGGGTPAASTAVGPITGFGSVFINGIRYEDNAARVTDDRGNTLDRDALRLGMSAEVSGRTNDDRLTGTADGIRIVSEVKGPVGVVDTIGGSFTVLGLTVTVDPDTQYANLGGLGFLRPGALVEVHGLRSGNTVRATRVELQGAPGSAIVDLKIRGVVSGLTGTAGGVRAFTLGSLAVQVPAGVVVTDPSGTGLANGRTVVVTAAAAPVGAAPLVATAVRVDSPRAVPADVAFAQVEGLVENLQPGTVAGTTTFVVAGLPVLVNTATAFEGGTSATSLSNGVRVEVRGPVTGGTLNANRVRLRVNGNFEERRLVGRITTFVSASNFTVRNTTVSASGGTVDFRGGTAANLVAGACVEIRGANTGTVLNATRVEFEDSDECSAAIVGATTPTGTGSTTSPGSGTTTSSLEVEGLVTEFVSAANFRVGGRLVNASAATFERGTLADLGLGDYVEVDGRLVNGVLQATTLKFDDVSVGGGSGGSDDDSTEVEVEGRIGTVQLVGLTRLVTVGGETLIVDSSTTIERGTLADLVGGALVEVRGRNVGGAVIATRVRFED